MIFAQATIAAVAAFLPSMVSAHIMMVGPSTVFTHHDGLDLNPLDPSGSNYPCFTTTGSTGEPPLYEPGSTQTIELQGSAVHGGGSCQISITYDNPPTKDSVFKVLKSFEGGCPVGSRIGNLPANPQNVLPGLDFEVPTDIPAGNAVIAWSWFNRIGNREMYMRCAPVKIGGSRTDTSALDALPDIFKANIGNGCKTIEGTDVIFPNAGPNRVGKGDAEPVGNCGSSNQPVLVKPKPNPNPSLNETYTPTGTPTGPVETTSLVEYPTETPTPTPTQVETSTPTPTPSAGSCVDGDIICTSATRWSICAHGSPIDMGSTAAGMECHDGKMQPKPIKMSVRFSHEHLRRRHNSGRFLP